MATFISLLQFTDKGISAIKESPKRATSWAAKVQKMGIQVKDQYWCLGGYDGVIVFEAPDVETATAALLAVDMLDNVRTHTLQVFKAGEMEKILGKVT